LCVAARRRYPADTSALAAARQFGAAAVIAALTPAGWDLADDVTLLISEFVTSALRAEASSIEVLVDLHRTRLDVTVTDDRPGTPSRSTATIANLHNNVDMDDRVTRILAAVSSSRGVQIAEDGKTATWARLLCDPRFTAGIACDQA
jgi:hypothetical protein